MNDQIVKRIKETRLERGMTQQDLADYLGRTAAAISELERGKVQVSASDLYRIALLLNKPIEFFYGEEYGEKEIQDLIAVIRKQSPESREQSVTMTRMLLQLQELSIELSESNDEQVPLDQIRTFYSIFVPFSVMVNNMTNQLNELREKLDQELRLHGIEPSV